MKPDDANAILQRDGADALREAFDRAVTKAPPDEPPPPERRRQLRLRRANDRSNEDDIDREEPTSNFASSKRPSSAEIPSRNAMDRRRRHPRRDADAHERRGRDRQDHARQAACRSHANRRLSARHEGGSGAGAVRHFGGRPQGREPEPAAILKAEQEPRALPRSPHLPLADRDACLAAPSTKLGAIAATPLWHALIRVVERRKPRIVIFDALADYSAERKTRAARARIHRAAQADGDPAKSPSSSSPIRRSPA